MMFLIVTVVVFFLVGYLTLYSTRLLKELENEMGIVEPYKAHGFVIGYSIDGDPFNVLHVVGVGTLETAADVYLRDAKIEFVVPVASADIAVRYVRGNFYQARMYGFNTLYITPKLWLSIALIGSNSLKRGVKQCL